MFQVEQDDSYGVLTAEIIIEGNFAKQDIYGYSFEQFEDGAILDIINNDNYVFLQLEHITDASEVNVTPPVDFSDWTASYDDNTAVSTETVYVKEGINIKGIIKECTITQDKDEILKELI